MLFICELMVSGYSKNSWIILTTINIVVTTVTTVTITHTVINTRGLRFILAKTLGHGCCFGDFRSPSKSRTPPKRHSATGETSVCDHETLARSGLAQLAWCSGTLELTKSQTIIDRACPCLTFVIYHYHWPWSLTVIISHLHYSSHGLIVNDNPSC